MINTINTATTGLESFSKGLSVISENVSNLNTAGFKQQRVTYFDLGDGQGDGMQNKAGDGVETGTPYRQFNQGEIRKSDNEIDAAIEGSGFFVIKNSDDKTLLTRAGQFEIDSAGVLKLRETGGKVQGLVGGTQLADINVGDKRTNPAKPTRTITFGNTLSSSEAQFSIAAADFFDTSGTKHSLKVDFTNQSSVAPGLWRVLISENGNTLLASEIRYSGSGSPLDGFSSISFDYAAPNGAATQPLTLDFSKTSSLSSGSSSIAVTGQDGYGVGGLTKLTFDESGRLKAAYSNGQSADLAQLALASTFQLERLQAVGKNLFAVDNVQDLRYGPAQADGLGTIRGGSLEASNVELTAQFSELIITQRAYQASSQVITTTNEMLSILFELKGRR